MRLGNIETEGFELEKRSVVGDETPFDFTDALYRDTSANSSESDGRGESTNTADREVTGVR